MVFPSHIGIGSVCSVRGKDPPMIGTIRFVGPTHFASGFWVGLELHPGVGAGKNNGTVKGTVYFKCPPNRGGCVGKDCLIHVVKYLNSLKSFLDSWAFVNLLLFYPLSFFRFLIG